MDVHDEIRREYKKEYKEAHLKCEKIIEEQAIELQKKDTKIKSLWEALMAWRSEYKYHEGDEICNDDYCRACVYIKEALKDH